MKWRTALVLSLVLVVPYMAAAQMHVPPSPAGAPHPPDLGKWWKNSEIVRDLGLSEAQTSQVERTFLEHRLKLIDLRADLERQEAQLQPLVEADHLDEAKVSEQIDQVLAARGRLEKANAMMMFSIRRVLNVEQWKKLQALQQERGRMHQRHMGQPFAPPPAPAAPPRSPDGDGL